MKKVVFLEGLPGVGKTTIVRTIRSMNIPYVHVVDEIVLKIDDKTPINQKDFILNDKLKLTMYEEGIIIIDRGPISTLSYNMARSKIDSRFNSLDVIKWFETIKSMLYASNVRAIYLTNMGESYYIPFENDMDPYGSIVNQKILELITLSNCEKYMRNFEIREYHKKEMEEVIHEIIS